ncbi:ParB family protein [Pantoea anthophila]|uniref:ParB family protein n=1 Tax=Pantoea anthophila TaxID=470931 RepID=UPI002DB57CE1|nr:ParB family protein [Pantoea anthophila]MEB5707938.1 ParB/RepB/Spo0J family partition protein [Pantoea anthophila]MEB6518809.1 ParB/RepB/Spo0J family partition protein [Pantoea anthophila]
MSKPIQRIGRKFGDSAIASMIDSSSQSRTFTLKSGAKATFVRQLIPHDDIETRTSVDPAINGRDQSSLTPESLQEITRTITLQQFFPAIGRVNGDKIEIMDGSRRRAACILSGASLEVLVTADALSLADARQLAADIQTAKEHNLRELGLRFMLMNENGMSKSEIAKAEGISNAKVSRAFQAAAVPAEFIGLFPVVSELTLQDYQLLLDVWEEAKAEAADVTELVCGIEQQLEAESLLLSANADEKKSAILNAFKSARRQLKKPVPVSKTVTEKLATFTTANTYARRKTNDEKRTVQYEFSRLPKEIAEQIDASIRQILATMK